MLKVNGHDVMEYGFRGPEVGRVLETLASDIVEHPAHNNREYLIGRIKVMRN
jgi:hypothetical protein